MPLRFPVCEPPRPDELLSSYYHRILQYNGIDDETFEKHHFGHVYCPAPYDIRREFRLFFSLLSTNMKIDDFFLSTSILPFQSVFLAPEELTNYVNNVFRDADKLSPFTRGLLKTIKICPECAKEDLEQFRSLYFHKAHQLSGVSFCAKHHVRLLVFCGKKKHLANFDLNDYSFIEDIRPDSDLIAYAEYAKAIMDSNIQTDISKTKEIIRGEIAKRGYKTQSVASNLYKEIATWDHRALYSIPEHKFSSWLATLRQKQPQTILAFLMFLFPEPKELIASLQPGSPILQEYTCAVCGNVYYATPSSQETGWGCPACDKKLSYDERYKRIVQIIGHGDYKVIEPFISNDKYLKHVHCICQKEMYFKPRKFIYYGDRCKCELRVPVKEMESVVEERGFKLVSYKNATDKMTLLHPTCGGTFDLTRATFLRNAKCRVCENPRTGAGVIQALSNKLQEVVGDEYELLSYDKSPADKHPSIVLRHKLCGNEFKIARHHFFAGKRCPQCTVIPPYRELDKVLSQASDGKYRLLGLTKDKGEVILVNTETNERKNYKREFLAQELSRPTPSKEFPDIKTGYTFPDWDEYLRLFIEYLQEYGSIPILHTEYKGTALGAWYRNMKSIKKKGKMSQERIQVLSDAGFVWS